MQQKQAGSPGGSEGDHVDEVRQQWSVERPDLDTSPVAVVARLGRAQSYLDQAVDTVFAEHGLTRQSWHVLAALRRVGQPYRLTPTELYRALMRSSGAITHTLHRLEYAGLAERQVNPDDGRSLFVTLTPQGVELVDRVAPLHLDNERRLLAGLTPEEQETLATLLRKLLVSFERDLAVPDLGAERRPPRRRRGSRT